MKIPTRANWIWLGLLLVASLALASCGKKISPQETRQARLDWNLKTTVAAYQEIGDTDAKWDEPAKRALEAYARSRAHMTDADDNLVEIMGTNSAAAVLAGCADPLIRYLYIRNSMSQTNSPQAFAEAFCKMADDMQQSAYPDIRKFYAALRTAEQLKYAAGRNPRTPPEVHQYRHLAVTNLVNSLGNKMLPAGEAADAGNDMLLALGSNEKEYEDCYNLIEGLLFKNWPDESAVWLLKGKAHIELAWFARGSGYADSVTADQWKLFSDRLAAAEKSLNHAWKLNPKDPRIALEMMRVELGQGKGRDIMERWFQRAMVLNPNNYDACSSKLNYLAPKWYGSTGDMLGFGRECVQNQKWGGHVPLILLDAHRSISRMFTNETDRLNYWSQPAVWTDVKAAFDRFFELNPEATGWYHDYAWYAYHAGQWDVLNEVIPKLGPINYEFFGGRDEFDRMIGLARQHAAGASPPR